MPPDILRNIFSHCVPNDTPEKIMQVSEAPLLLTQICRHWRDLAITTPTLWSTIFLKIPSPPQNSFNPGISALDAYDQDLGIDIEVEGALEGLSALLIGEWCRKAESLVSLANIWLSRAKGCPLTIFFRDINTDRPSSSSVFDNFDHGSLTQNPVDHLLSLLCTRVSQWAQLDLLVTSSSEASFLSQISSQTPHLRSVRMQWSSFGFSDAAPNSPSSFHISKSTPLQHLSLDGFQGNFKDISVAWNNLTELACTGCPVRYFGAYNSSGMIPSFSPSVALALLQDCPNLVQCELHLLDVALNHRDSAELHAVSNAVHLPHLVRLVVFENRESPSLGFFKSLNLPLLTSLSWSSTVSPFSAYLLSPGPLSLCPLLATSGHQIQSLEFGAVTVFVTQVIDALKLAVGVKELTINLCSVVVDPVSPPSPPIGTPPWGIQPQSYYRDELLQKLTPSSSEDAICPNLVILKLTMSNPSDITTKALKTLVAQREYVESGSDGTNSMHVPLERVSVRFIAPVADVVVGRVTPGRAALPKRWQEDRLNSGFDRRVISVEWRMAITPAEMNPYHYAGDARRPFQTYWNFESNQYEHCQA
ncbi:hypothetical protein BKA70DRAFT_1269181 [Coprinopsis sp. MPI-PUGE-AT-0042]|nr:hypothetical protein BKA70DRAFT_1269181 [Coprinopsis sp. MPI-PUGE-AT-0042]